MIGKSKTKKSVERIACKIQIIISSKKQKVSIATITIYIRGNLKFVDLIEHVKGKIDGSKKYKQFQLNFSETHLRLYSRDKKNELLSNMHTWDLIDYNSNIYEMYSKTKIIAFIFSCKPSIIKAFKKIQNQKRHEKDSNIGKIRFQKIKKVTASNTAWIDRLNTYIVRKIIYAYIYQYTNIFIPQDVAVLFMNYLWQELPIKQLDCDLKIDHNQWTVIDSAVSKLGVDFLRCLIGNKPFNINHSRNTFKIKITTNININKMCIGIVSNNYIVPDAKTNMFYDARCGIRYFYQPNRSAIFECNMSKMCSTNKNNKCHISVIKTASIIFNANDWKCTFYANDRQIGSVFVIEDKKYYPVVTYITENNSNNNYYWHLYKQKTQFQVINYGES